ncbi:unnamed protein product [Ilex paraguariensis]|uniref:Uncharacterized protein n=1 Tax=Ilex paraguariensis TaxID=185542 RepID=A0ABC8TE12_9AQUA
MTTENDEVSELLRAAEDEMLLKLSVDSHMSRGSSSHIIDPDLDRRFLALKSKPKPSKIKPSTNPSAVPLRNPPPELPTGSMRESGDHEETKVDDDDLLARFSALKGSIPSYLSSSVAFNDSQRQSKGEEKEEENSDTDEVEKVIKWAIDAARLDPSPPSDNSDNDDSDDDDDDDDDDWVVDGKKKGQRK